MRHFKRKNSNLTKLIVFILIFTLVISVFLFYKKSIKENLNSSTSAVVSLSQKITRQPDSALKKKWKTTLAKQNANVNIAVYNHKTKQTTIYNSDTGATYQTASIVKVSVLTNLLQQHEENNTALSTTEETLAQEMIEQSDNNATTTLLSTYEGSYSAPDALFNDLDMSQSKMNANAWGLSTTTAHDQVKLLNALAYGKNSTIDRTDRDYVLNLMANIDSDQDWGVSTGVDSNATVELKNGWLEYGSGWIVNSIGHVKTSDNNYTIAVLTNGNSTEQDGIDLIEKLATLTAQHLDSD